MTNWSVVWNIDVIFPYIGNVIIPNDSYFSEGLKRHYTQHVASNAHVQDEEDDDDSLGARNGGDSLDGLSSLGSHELPFNPPRQDLLGYPPF